MLLRGSLLICGGGGRDPIIILLIGVGLQHLHPLKQLIVSELLHPRVLLNWDGTLFLLLQNLRRDVVLIGALRLLLLVQLLFFLLNSRREFCCSRFHLLGGLLPLKTLLVVPFPQHRIKIIAWRAWPPTLLG